MDLALEREVRLFYVVALAGALGGLAHACTACCRSSGRHWR
jgi:hypothetical protein